MPKQQIPKKPAAGCTLLTLPSLPLPAGSYLTSARGSCLELLSAEKKRGCRKKLKIDTAKMPVGTFFFEARRARYGLTRRRPLCPVLPERFSPTEVIMTFSGPEDICRATFASHPPRSTERNRNEHRGRPAKTLQADFFLGPHPGPVRDTHSWGGLPKIKPSKANPPKNFGVWPKPTPGPPAQHPPEPPGEV